MDKKLKVALIISNIVFVLLLIIMVVEYRKVVKKYDTTEAYYKGVINVTARQHSVELKNYADSLKRLAAKEDSIIVIKEIEYVKEKSRVINLPTDSAIRYLSGRLSTKGSNR
jgi:hypothetical protein